MSLHPLFALARVPRRAGLFLDFDGTLSDTVDDPARAVPLPGVPDLLLELQRLLGRVVIVSGRPIEYLDPLIPRAIDLIGLYGLEQRHNDGRQTRPEAEAWRSVMNALTGEAEARFGPTVIEPKGLSLTVHYRSDEALAAPMRDWIEEVAARTGVEVRPAKRSFEAHPPVAYDKGTAVVELASGLDAIAYVGDDLGDLPAFAGLDSLATRGVATVRVAVGSDEVPPALLERADHVVDGPAGVRRLLEELVEVIASA